MRPHTRNRHSVQTPLKINRAGGKHGITPVLESTAELLREAGRWWELAV